MRSLVAAFVVFMTAGLAPAADAQVFVGASGPRPGAAEISGGGFWAGGQSLSASAATMTPNLGQPSFELFRAEPKLGASFGALASLGVYITRSLAVEGGFQFARPEYSVRLTSDAEGAPDITSSETITSYLFTGSLLYHFGSSAKTIPFVAGGGGYIRDVHSNNSVVDTGTEYHAKAGIKTWFGSARKTGIRAEGGISIRDGGFSPEGKVRYVPIAAASFLYLF